MTGRTSLAVAGDGGESLTHGGRCYLGGGSGGTSRLVCRVDMVCLVALVNSVWLVELVFEVFEVFAGCRLDRVDVESQFSAAGFVPVQLVGVGPPLRVA